MRRRWVVQNLFLAALAAALVDAIDASVDSRRLAGRGSDDHRPCGAHDLVP
jgi:hypothetical protein